MTSAPSTIANAITMITSQEAYQLLQSNAQAVLIDVRTQAEWQQVGIPMLIAMGKEPLLLSWRVAPTMMANPDFVAQIKQAITDRSVPCLFLCKSGGRSHEAAETLLAEGYSACYNVADGFEGRGGLVSIEGKSAQGWIKEGLPWELG
jgi:rhodanese-related sulfurtransferase